MRAVLGLHIVSAVGLEQFDAKRTFPLAATIGKLANIIEEISHPDKAAEGIIKNFVTGGIMTIERKNKDPFVAPASARLTIACNELPRFTDRSNGLWRRMILVPFKVQLLDPAKQDKLLTSQQWWERSGELPGIFNWAIQGLIRLQTQGYFSEPPDSVQIKAEYKRESNPAATFLVENCISAEGQSVASSRLYSAYASWAKSQGYHPLASQTFAREITKVFPKAKISRNPLRQDDGVRSRAWANIALISEGIDEAAFQSPEFGTDGTPTSQSSKIVKEVKTPPVSPAGNA